MKSEKDLFKRKLIHLSILCLMLFQYLYTQYPDNNYQGNEKQGHTIKFGITGGIDIINPEKVNNFISEYIDYQGTVVDQFGTTEMKIGLGIAGYGSITFSKTYEIRPTLYYFIAPKIIAVVGGSDLNVLLSALAPGCAFFINFPLQDDFFVRIGGGPFYYMQKANFEIENSANLEFTGKKLGFHIHLGGDYYITPDMGLSGDILYRSVNNTDNVKYDGRDIDFELDYSGFEIQGGFFLNLQ
jgi:hypothetical protein